MRRWQVAGGLLADHRGLLLVANRRRDGSIDWSTPGGVVDEGETPIVALGREVTEETGLVVDAWAAMRWTVEVTFVDLDMHLMVEVHEAASFSGDLSSMTPTASCTTATSSTSPRPTTGFAADRPGSPTHWPSGSPGRGANSATSATTPWGSDRANYELSVLIHE